MFVIILDYTWALKLENGRFIMHGKEVEMNKGSINLEREANKCTYWI